MSIGDREKMSLNRVGWIGCGLEKVKGKGGPYDCLWEKIFSQNCTCLEKKLYFVNHIKQNL